MGETQSGGPRRKDEGARRETDGYIWREAHPRKASCLSTVTGGLSETKNIQEYTYLCPSPVYLLPPFRLWYTRAMDDPTEIFLNTVTAPADVDVVFKEDIPPSGGSVAQPAQLVEQPAFLPGKTPPEEPALPPLSVDEDSFALAVIEYSGNVAAAYRAVFGEDVKSPGARGNALMALPQVAHRVQELSETIKQSTLISMGVHLQELAIIRDMAKHQGQLKVALSAERTRGEVAGLYNHFEHGQQSKGPTNIQINLVSKYDVNI